jgi:hypothetical protein
MAKKPSKAKSKSRSGDKIPRVKTHQPMNQR